MGNDSVFREISRIFSGHLPETLAVVLLLILVVLAIIFWILRSSEKGEEKKTEPPGKKDFPGEEGKPAPELPVTESMTSASGSLAGAFSQSVKVLKSSSAGKNFKYDIPWFLMVGEDEKEGVNFESINGFSSGNDRCRFWFLSSGVVIHVEQESFTGSSEKNRKWDRVLNLLQKHRHQRPVDGIVLTVSAETLLAAAGDEAMEDNLKEHAGLVFQRLNQAQKQTGMQLPVYVLVTGTERVTGFSEFCGSIPGRLKHDIFGWSSPYSIGNVYSSEWIDEAFDHIAGTAEKITYEIYTDRRSSSGAGKLLFLSGGLRSMAGPLKKFTDIIFQENIYSKQSLFRGLYFCGNPGALSGDEAKETFFLKDLLGRKVFPEFSLAAPMKSALVSRNRLILSCQVLSIFLLLFFSVGTWISYGNLKKDQGDLVPVLKQINRTLEAQKIEKGSQNENLGIYALLSSSSSRELFEERALLVLKGISGIRNLDYMFLPTSWFSDIHSRIESALTLTYDKIIFKAMFVQLLKKVKSIFEFGKRPPRGSPCMDSNPDFRTMEKFVKDLRELETHVDVYNNLKRSRNINVFGDLARYLYNTELPPAFFTNERYYFNALKATKYREFSPDIVKIKAKKFTMKKLTRNFTESFIEANPLKVELMTLAGMLDMLSMVPRKGQDREKIIKDILVKAEYVEKLLKDECSQWVYFKSFKPGERYVQLLTSIGGSGILGMDMEKQTRRWTGEAFNDFKKEIASISSRTTGKLLSIRDVEMDRALISALDNKQLQEEIPFLKSDRQEIELSERLTEIREGLGKFVGSSFMAEGEEEISFAVPPGVRIHWNNDRLSSVIKLFEGFDEFLKKEIGDFPEDLQKSMFDLARDRLAGNIISGIMEAMSFQPMGSGFIAGFTEQDMAAETALFSQSARNLGQILLYFQRLGLSRYQADFSELLSWQTTTLLEAADNIFESEEFYNVRGGNLSWWKGKAGLSVEAFDVLDNEELKNYLDVQRQRMMHISGKYVKPLVLFMSEQNIPVGTGTGTTLFKWNRIIKTLDRYNSKKPGNSLGRLEKFILYDMNRVTFESISEITAMDESVSSDFYLRKERWLRKLISERGEVQQENRFASDYKELRGMFMDRLAGRYPFSRPGEKTGFPEATPASIRDFFSLFDRLYPDLETQFDKNETTNRRAVIFLKQMAGASEFFKKLDLGAGDLPSLLMEVNFRTDREFEKSGSGIIEWDFSAGENMRKRGGTKASVRWSYGEPVTLGFRWAKDGMVRPVYGGPFSALDTVSKRISYPFRERWSLLRLLEVSRTGLPVIEDPAVSHLEFNMETEAEGPVAGVDKVDSRVFVSLRLLTDDKEGREIEYPEFPWEFPELSN